MTLLSYLFLYSQLDPPHYTLICCYDIGRRFQYFISLSLYVHNLNIFSFFLSILLWKKKKRSGPPGGSVLHPFSLSVSRFFFFFLILFQPYYISLARVHPFISISLYLFLNMYIRGQSAKRIYTTSFFFFLSHLHRHAIIMAVASHFCFCWGTWEKIARCLQHTHTNMNNSTGQRRDIIVLMLAASFGAGRHGRCVYWLLPPIPKEMTTPKSWSVNKKKWGLQLKEFQ